MTLASLEALEARIAAATGPDREIDAELFDALGIPVREFDPGDGDVSQWREWPDGTKVANTRLTASIDAIVALITRKLPGLGWIARTGIIGGDGRGKDEPYAALLSSQGGEALYSSYAPTPALALSLAFVRAMRAKEEAK